MKITQRPRRNRSSEALRSLVRETTLTSNDLLAPLFITDSKDELTAIKSMPGQYRLGEKQLLNEAEELMDLGVKSMALFPVCPDSSKDSKGTQSYNPDHFYQRRIRLLKEKFPSLLIMTDVALDPYSCDGHDGIVDPKSGQILNDPTLEVLAKMALEQARSGCDIVGPSDMMDGRVGHIREFLDAHGFENVAIMSYTAKYASAFYGPFREALDSAPRFGDKKTYQMDPANTREAIREADLDIREGADILMIKPALAYLDIIQKLRQHTQIPIAAYNVSGEYAMIKAAAEKGWLDGDRAMMESLLSIKRAGADIILTYFAKDAAKLLH